MTEKEKKYLGLSIFIQEKMENAAVDALQKTNLRKTHYMRLAGLQGLIAEFDRLFGDAKNLAEEHSQTEGAMKEIIADRFNVLLNSFMGKS